MHRELGAKGGVAKPANVSNKNVGQEDLVFENANACGVNDIDDTLQCAAMLYGATIRCITRSAFGQERPKRGERNLSWSTGRMRQQPTICVSYSNFCNFQTVEP